MKFQQVYVEVDTSHRLLWVGGEWDEFALQNAAPKAVANEVLSTSMLDYIAGEDTKALTRRLVETVLQTKQPLRIEYRCDSPAIARKFQLTIQPMKDDRALMVHDLQDAWHFSTPLQPWRFDPAAPDAECSFCGDVQLAEGQGWTSCDEIGDRHPAAVTYCICPDCELRAGEVMDQVHIQAPEEVPRE